MATPKKAASSDPADAAKALVASKPRVDADIKRLQMELAEATSKLELIKRAEAALKNLEEIMKG